MTKPVPWKRVSPAATTQFREDFSVDAESAARVIDALVRDGVSGLVVCGTVGENTSLTLGQKLEVVEVACSAAAGRVTVREIQTVPRAATAG